MKNNIKSEIKILEKCGFSCEKRNGSIIVKYDIHQIIILNENTLSARDIIASFLNIKYNDGYRDAKLDMWKTVVKPDTSGPIEFRD